MRLQKNKPEKIEINGVLLVLTKGSKKLFKDSYDEITVYRNVTDLNGQYYWLKIYDTPSYSDMFKVFHQLGWGGKK